MQDAVVAGRFELFEVLGRGALGVVHRAWDRRLGEVVALKLPLDVHRPGVHRLRHEFRVRQEVWHPSLVAFHGLFDHAGLPVIAMEFLDGADLPVALGDLTPGLRGERIRRLGHQLVGAIAALHDGGLLHGDLKPSHLVVTRTGRAVVLDLDLSSRFRRLGLVPEGSHGVSGTPGYLAPELFVEGQGSTPASDVWALGASLFDALVGRPCAGPDAAATWWIERPRWQLPDDLPAVVVDVIAAMLHEDPAKRPTAREAAAAWSDDGTTPDLVAGRRVVVGRDAELAALRDVDAASAAGMRAVVIGGPAGIGKTSLVEAWLRDDPASAALWRSRCLPDDATPFRAVAGWIDGLAAWIEADGPTGDAAAADLALLCRLFPDRLHGLVPPGAPRIEEDVSGEDAADALARRIGAVAALCPLRVWLDDAQWADPDAPVFLAALVRARPPGVVLIVTSRTHLPWLALGAVDREIDLEGLDGVATVALADALGVPAVAPLLTSWLGRTAGNPFLLRCLLAIGPDERAPVQDVLRAGIGRLDPATAEVLSVLAVASVPLPRGVLQAATDVAEIEARLQALLGLGFVALCALDGERAFEPAHALVRVAAVEPLDDDSLRRLHGRIAVSWERDPRASAHTLAHHYDRAGRRDRAIDCTRRAAEASFATQAWHQSAEHDRWLVAHGVDDETVRRRLAVALGRAGSAREAAEAWLRVADAAEDRPGRLEGRVRACEILLGIGELAEGEALLRPVLADVGFTLPRTWVGTLARLAWWRLRSAVWSWRGRPRRVADAELGLAIDVGWTLAGALGSTDVFKGLAFQAWHAFEAARSGDARQRARALASELAYRLTGGREDTGTIEVTRQARERLSALSPGEERAIVAWGYGYGAFVRGEIDQAIGHLTDAIDGWGLDRTGGWECDHAQRHLGWALRWAGRYDEVHALCTRALAHAWASGNVVHGQQVRLSLVAHGWLVRGDPERATATIDEAIGPSLADLPFGTRYLAHHARTEVALYSGDAAAATRASDRLWAEARRTRGALHVRAETWRHRALAAWLVDPAGATPVLREACRALKDEVLAWPRGLVAAFSGAIASAEGDVETAVAAYACADALLMGCGMAVLALAARRHAAVASGDVDDSLRGIGVHDIGRWLRITIPGPAIRREGGA